MITYVSFENLFSYLDTLINMLKGNVGCGILAMGDAFKNGGLFLSPVLTFIIGIICVYNQHLLVSNYYTIISFDESIFQFFISMVF